MPSCESLIMRALNRTAVLLSSPHSWANRIKLNKISHIGPRTHPLTQPDTHLWPALMNHTSETRPQIKSFLQLDSSVLQEKVSDAWSRMKMTSKIILQAGTMQHASKSISTLGLCIAGLFTISSLSVVFVDTSLHKNRADGRQIIEESPEYQAFERAGKS